VPYSCARAKDASADVGVSAGERVGERTAPAVGGALAQ